MSKQKAQVQILGSVNMFYWSYEKYLMDSKKTCHLKLLGKTK